MTASPEDFAAEAEKLAGRAFDPEALFVLRLAAHLGAETSRADGSPPAHWMAVVAAMLIAPDPASRWLQWGARQGLLTSDGLVPPAPARAAALAAARKGTDPQRAPDGWFTQSTGQQLPNVGTLVAVPTSSDPALVQSVHLLASFLLFPVGNH